MLASLLRRALVERPSRDVSRERRTLARGLERLACDARRIPVRTRGPLPPIIRRDVAAAVVPPAAAIAAALRDPDVDVADDDLRAIRTFLTRGCSSPLFDRDPAMAMLAIADLERCVGQARHAGRSGARDG